MTERKYTPAAAIVPQERTIEAIDLFCGVGGLSCGLASQGVRVVAGIDIDPACQYPFTANHREARFMLIDPATRSMNKAQAA